MGLYIKLAFIQLLIEYITIFKEGVSKV